jgi:hypothetical protein
VVTVESWDLKGLAQKANMENLLVAVAILFAGF